ncbi:MAG: AMP-binding protein [Nitrospiraceae bacterium]|nr:AMP-binding protein [Nitrospiraceae bacterium]
MHTPQSPLTWQYVEKWAERKPDAEALVFQDERLTWAEFARQMDLVAKAYLELGVAKGDRIAFLGMARNEFMTSYMAANKIGAMWLGLSPKFTDKELAYMLDDCGAKVLIALDEHAGIDVAGLAARALESVDTLETCLIIGQAPAGAMSFADCIGQPREHLDQTLADRAAQVSSADNALLLYTSGSTGRPKGVVLTHDSIIKNIAIEAPRFQIDEDCRTLLHFPINHVAADVELGFAAIYAGAALVFMDHFDPAHTLEIIKEERITLIGQVPAMYLLEMKLPMFKDMDFSRVRTFVWGGAGVPEIVVDALVEIRKSTGALLVTGFGMTETSGFITYTEPDDSVERLVKSAGKAPDGFDLRIVNETRNEVADGTVGEIAVRGPFLMKEYWNNPRATAAVIDDDGWFYTSDLAYKDADGYIYISGRKSEMFKTGGENVFPREVEAIIELHDSVLAAAVIGVPDEVFQEVGCAFVALKPGCELTEAGLRAHCGHHLANFKVPKQFEFRTQLPLLANGKISKRALREEIEKKGP